MAAIKKGYLADLVMITTAIGDIPTAAVSKFIPLLLTVLYQSLTCVTLALLLPFIHTLLLYYECPHPCPAPVVDMYTRHWLFGSPSMLL